MHIQLVPHDTYGMDTRRKPRMFPRFVRVPGDYYDQSLEVRRECLSAASVDHLCKSIVMENTRAHESVTVRLTRGFPVTAVPSRTQSFCHHHMRMPPQSSALGRISTRLGGACGCCVIVSVQLEGPPAPATKGSQTSNPDLG